MEPLHIDIKEDTLNNKCYRKIVYTDPTMQIILQTLKPGEDVDFEKHPVTQFLRCEEGNGEVIIGNYVYTFRDDIAITIPLGERHKIINSSVKYDLKFYTIYSKPVHSKDEDKC